MENIVNEILFAVAVTAFIINLVILLGLKFGNKSLTHLSLRPYWISLWFFTFFVIEQAQLCYVKNVTFGGDTSAFWKAEFDKSSVYRNVETGFTIIRNDLLLVFIMSRTHE